MFSLVLLCDDQILENGCLVWSFWKVFCLVMETFVEYRGSTSYYHEESHLQLKKNAKAQKTLQTTLSTLQLKKYTKAKNIKPAFFVIKLRLLIKTTTETNATN